MIQKIKYIIESLLTKRPKVKDFIDLACEVEFFYNKFRSDMHRLRPLDISDSMFNIAMRHNQLNANTMKVFLERYGTVDNLIDNKNEFLTDEEEYTYWTAREAYYEDFDNIVETIDLLKKALPAIGDS